MSKAKVLFVSQTIEPYIEDGNISYMSRHLPQAIQERGKEIRTFMPRYGCVNERRYQLHEVIRLSGMNLILNDSDHPLIIKVASIQAARMQVYFIDNEEYFKRKFTFRDDKGKFYGDNDERMAFYCRGVIETVKKLGWAPDVIHCQGWMTSLMPYYLKTLFNDDPIFANSKVVYSVYDNGFKEKLSKDFVGKLGLKDEWITPELTQLNNANYVDLTNFAINMSDAVIYGSEKIDEEIEKTIAAIDKPVLGFQSLEDYADAYSAFYDELLIGEHALAQ